ncbi:MAG: hypothetical protein HY815_32515 [Candidatus Riflebacteria bacterium]|nr:hypothetical protein [Candidatus Riflebacteria bacterium]
MSVLLKSPSSQELGAFQEILEEWAGLKAAGNASCAGIRAQLVTALCRENGFTCVAELVEQLRANPGGALARRVLARVTVGETQFFRHFPQFLALERLILPQLLRQRAETQRKLVCWSAGCSSGEEPYSLAILLCRMIPDADRWNITILGTDISEIALEHARRGSFTRWSFRSVPPALMTFFQEEGQEFIVHPFPRGFVRFAWHNLAKGPFPPERLRDGEVDLILCRNVLIYWSKPAVAQLLERFSRLLSPTGYLLAGPSETPMVAEMGNFESVTHGSVTLFGPRREPPAPASRPASASTAAWDPPTTPVGAILGAVCDRSSHGPGGARPGPPAAADPAPRSATRETVPVVPVVPEAPRTDAGSTVREAWEAANRGDLPLSLKLVAGALLQRPLDPECLLLKGMILADLGQLPSAAEALQKCLFLRWDLVMGHYHLGRILLKMGDRRRGRGHLKTARSLVSKRRPDEPIPLSDGLSCGRLLEQLDMLSPPNDEVS